MSIVSIDKGFSWAIPIGGFITNFIVGGLAKSFGIIMISTQELYDTSVAPLTLAGGLIYTFMYSFSLIGIYLSQKYGCRIIMMIGGLGCVMSFLGAWLARTVTIWVICIGGGIGVSLSFIYSPLFVMIGRCFKKRVGVAMGISVAGVSVGQMAFPYIITYVIDEYGARNVFLIGAGIASNFIVTAALMPRYIKEELQQYNHNNTRGFTEMDSPYEIEKEVSSIQKQRTSKSNVKSIKLKFTYIQIVMLSIFIAAKIFGDIGDIGLSIALSPYGDICGISSDHISLAIGIAGAVDLFTRIIIGFVSDQWWCRRSVILTFAWLLEALNTFFFLWWPYLTNYIIFYGIFGFCSGTAITLMTIVLTDLVGQENLAISFAFMMLSLGLVIGVGQFVVGYLADVTGNYIWSLRFIGMNLFLAFLIMSLEYPLKKIIFDTTIDKDCIFDNKLSDEWDKSKKSLNGVESK